MLLLLQFIPGRPYFCCKSTELLDLNSFFYQILCSNFNPVCFEAEDEVDITRFYVRAGSNAQIPQHESSLGRAAFAEDHMTLPACFKYFSDGHLEGKWNGVTFFKVKNENVSNHLGAKFFLYVKRKRGPRLQL